MQSWFYFQCLNWPSSNLGKGGILNEGWLDWNWEKVCSICIFYRLYTLNCHIIERQKVCYCKSALILFNKKVTYTTRHAENGYCSKKWINLLKTLNMETKTLFETSDIPSIYFSINTLDFSMNIFHQKLNLLILPTILLTHFFFTTGCTI